METFTEKYGKEMPNGDGDCFQVAAKTVTIYEMQYPTAVLVHGEPLGTDGEALGKRFPHAWVEFTDKGETFVVDKSNGNDVLMLAEHYYAIGNIESANVKRYSRTEVLAMMLKHEHYGPWHIN